MTETQPDLLDARPPAAARQMSWLERLLHDAKCWMTAHDITLTTGGRVIDRDIRELASECPDIISGQKGYKHVAHATPAEVDRSANWLVSQGKKMIKRGIAQRRAAHKIFG